MIDLFFPGHPYIARKGRVVAPLTLQDATEYARPKGRDPMKARARQARYRARMRADAARYAKKLAQNRAWHQAHREAEIAKMRARRASLRPIAFRDLP